MPKLSIYEKYSMEDISKELCLSKKVANGIRKHFGEPLSLLELSRMTSSDFYKMKGMGFKSWQEFSAAMSGIEIPGRTVSLIDKRSERIVVEIDISRPFYQVILELSKIMSYSK